MGTKATLARTQQTSAKKKKKKKKKVTKYPGGKRPKGVHKSKASIAGGKTKMSRPEMTKALWVYIKKNKLNKGRTIAPDAKLKKVLPANSLSMFKMPGMLKKHIK